MAKQFSRTYDKYNEETQASIKRHISHLYGFKVRDIVLMEASYTWFVWADTKYTYCTEASFSVHGIGMTTDFFSILPNPAFDDANALEGKC